MTPRKQVDIHSGVVVQPKLAGERKIWVMQVYRMLRSRLDGLAWTLSV
jgi:hypothetical protein